jgi:hypothetical protein
MRNRNLAAIGKACLKAGCRLPVKHGHLMPGFGEIPCAADADDTCAENQNIQTITPARA